MARKAHRTSPALHEEELAVISTLDPESGVVMDSMGYASVLGIAPDSMRILAEEALPLGEMLQISLILQGQSGIHALKGIVRSVTPRDKRHGYVVGVELLPEDQPAGWHHQFH